jgi:hypothetical protein
MSNLLSMKRFSISIFLALILMGCRSRSSATTSTTSDSAASSILAASVQTLTPAQTPKPIILENGWYLYTDPDGEFSFAYPPTAVLNAGQNTFDLSKNITLQFQLPDKGYQGMSIRVEPNPKRLQGAEIANQLFERSAQKPANAAFADSLQPIQVGGLPAVQTTIPASNTEVTVIVPFEARVLIASPVHEPSVLKVDQAALDLFYQILDTLKFSATQ